MVAELKLLFFHQISVFCPFMEDVHTPGSVLHRNLISTVGPACQALLKLTQLLEIVLVSDIYSLLEPTICLPLTRVLLIYS